MQVHRDLGFCYHYGKGISLNHKKAFEWYMKSSNNEIAYSYFNLGYSHQNYPTLKWMIPNSNYHFHLGSITRR
ncbi:unnamed protein product [Rhizophagus irregularis]|nr:unnamed protein product [Rhizophagus irregularis]